MLCSLAYPSFAPTRPRGADGHVRRTSFQFLLDCLPTSDSSLPLYSRRSWRGRDGNCVIGRALGQARCSGVRTRYDITDPSIASASGLIPTRQVGSSLLSSNPSLESRDPKPLLSIDSHDIDSAKLLPYRTCIILRRCQSDRCLDLRRFNHRNMLRDSSFHAHRLVHPGIVPR